MEVERKAKAKKRKQKVNKSLNVSSFREEDFMYKKGYNADANKDKAMKNFLI